jgi:hypothetical protein
MTRLWETQRLAVILFAIASGLALFFAGQMISRTIYWADPAHIRVLPEPWMTPGYVARSWDVTRAEMGIILDTPEPAQKGHTLEEIAEDQGRDVEDLMDHMMDTLPQYSRAK